MRGRAIQRDNPEYKIETVSRVYKDANQKLGSDWYDCENWDLPISSPGDLEIGEWIGTGKYSDVFIGYRGKEKVALKVMKPVRPMKYNREAKILFILKGGPNVVNLQRIIQNPDSQQLTFVFDYAPNCDYQTLLQTFTNREVKFYLYQLMRALQFSHSHGIMHRDIKPQNIMYDRNTKSLQLIDWGLAEFYHPGARYNIHVASRHFKAIELLVDYQFYDYSVDIWGFGVTMAGIIFHKMPFFKGNDDFDMVNKITAVLGTDDFYDYLEKYGIDIPSKMEKQISKSRGKKWSSFINKLNEELATPEAIDLISKCLRYDHMERITAEEALNHPYFDDVRNE
ncbi:CMGC family protein kinase [Tritrichomonas foetus]|uniref:non-specific serine/threonine protein kinase n=1 Tax=Tritrichomonas foetus TaxID=1144522 RepID=A0A1J4JLM2_9EUKA|nr:CMGC family protein kinase [Tritrichomonas foetus]|eukprot:OHS98445.1 CMGC family protein kinase [Tritrichomonas foetus]